jgi:hypothetical protein
VKEAAEQTAAAPEAVPAPTGPTALPPTQAGRILALQRSAGNRAVAQLLARADTTTIKKHVREETTGAENVNWDASFDVTFDENASTPTMWLTIKVKLNPDSGITDDDLTHFRIRVRSRFSLMWDSKFVFHEHRTIWSDRDWLVRPEVKFVDSDQHLTVSLHKGKGADNRQNWYYDSPDYTHVHEVSHQMGLLDEYANVGVPNRKVYDDHSIMGDYYKEGMTEATAKPRHGERLASIIGAQVDKNLTSKMR